MNMKKFPFIILFSLIAVACSYDTLPEIPKPIRYHQNPAPEPPVPEPEAGGSIPVVFSGSFGDVIATRAGINNGQMSWNAGDRILILWNGGFNYAGASAEGASAEFSTEVNEADTYWAVYPSSTEASLDSKGFSVTVPDKQNGEFDKVNIAVASTGAADQNLVFRNLCGLGAFTLSRNDIAKVEFSSLSSDALAGNALLSIGQDGIPSVTSLSSPVKSITVVPATGNSFAAGTYYFAAVPGALDAGVSFTFTTSSGGTILGKAIATPDALNRSEIRSFGTLDNISTADVLQLSFVFGPEAGTKETYDPQSKWPASAGVEGLTDGVTYTYTLDGTEYSFHARDVSGDGKFSWRTNNTSGYADCIGMQTDKVYFGLPALEGFRLKTAVVGQCRRGNTDNGEDKVTTAGITDRIPEGAEEKSYIAGGELQSWTCWSGKKDKKVVDREFRLSGTEAKTIYYLNSNTSSIGLYFAHLVLTYEKTNNN